MPDQTSVRRRSLDLAPPRVETERRDDGSMVLRSPVPLGQYERHLGEMLRASARAAPDRTFLAERDGDGWRRLTYAAAVQSAEAVGQGLIDHGLGPARPVMILSANSVNQGILILGAHLAGVPLAPVSPAYSTVSSDFQKLRSIFEQTRPGMIFVEQAAPFAKALAALADAYGSLPVLVVGAGDLPAGAESFDRLLAASPGSDLAAREAALGPESVAKYLFTSGSTGMPKGVINTHGMLTANQRMVETVWPFAAETPPVMVDWLPWNHTFGGNFDFNFVLKHQGSLYIDAGRPVPGLFQESLRNLTEISQTIALNVPAAYGQLLPHLERDAALRERFFARLQLVFYAGSALPADLWQRFEAVMASHLGEHLFFTTSWGSTETAPAATSAHFPIDRPGMIGLPLPGVEVKLAPIGNKLEMRVKGANVTPGYLGDPDRTRDAFDEEGFFRMGDAGQLADADDPAKGLMFDGRVAENFKLTTGTWVAAGALRLALVAAASPVVQDAVITGHDRAAIGALVWLNPAGCRQIIGEQGDAEEVVADHPAIRRHLEDALQRHNENQVGSSTRIRRLAILTTPPSIDAGEITDKGYINQLAALDGRAGDVSALYEDPPGPQVIVV
jgi:feruloyl-CoA synthase